MFAFHISSMAWIMFSGLPSFALYVWVMRPSVASPSPPDAPVSIRFAYSPILASSCFLYVSCMLEMSFISELAKFAVFDNALPQFGLRVSCSASAKLRPSAA